MKVRKKYNLSLLPSKLGIKQMQLIIEAPCTTLSSGRQNKNNTAIPRL